MPPVSTTYVGSDRKADVSSWHKHPAGSDVNMGGYDLHNVTQISDGTYVALKLTGNGNVTNDVGQIQISGNPIPYSSTGTEYDIQKNGTDGAGVINFKT